MEMLPIFLQQPRKPDVSRTPPGVQRVEQVRAEQETNEDKKLKQAAQEFESIFLAQLLSKMRESVTKTDFLGAQSTSMKIFNGMLDEQYALRMAESGQVGLAEMIIEQLTGASSKSSIMAVDNLPGFTVPLDDLSQAAFIEPLSVDAGPSQLQRLQAELLLANQRMDSHLSRQNASQFPSVELPAGAQDFQTYSSHTVTLNLNQIRNLDAASLAALVGSTSGEATDSAGLARLLNPDQVLIQIINKISPRLGAGVHEAIIDLEPPTLGRLHIRLILEDGALSARVHARSLMVGEIVRSNLSQLRSALHDQGIQVESFHVTAGDTNSQGEMSAWQGHQGDWQESMSYRSGTSAVSNGTESPQNSDGTVTVATQPASDESYAVNHLV